MKHSNRANLLEQRFTATTDPKTGEIVVNRSVQAQEVPWYSYDNAIYTNIRKPADLRDSLSSDPKQSGQLLNSGDGIAIKSTPLLDASSKPRLAPDGKPMLDVETIPGSAFKAGFVPGTGLGTFTPKPDPTDKSAKPGDPLAAAQVTKSDVHVSTADNPITTAKDIVFPDGTRLPGWLEVFFRHHIRWRFIQIDGSQRKGLGRQPRTEK